MTLRRWPRRILIAGASLLGLGLLGRGALFIPAVYFRVAYFLIERSSVMRDRIDWPAVRAEADALRRGARRAKRARPLARARRRPMSRVSRWGTSSKP